jgi:hypothetical protein
MICPRCHEEIADKSKFCPECGQALKAVAIPDQRTKVARPEGRPIPSTDDEPTHRQATATVHVNEGYVEGQFRVIEAIGERFEVQRDAGLLVVYADEGLRERIVWVSHDAGSYPPRDWGNARQTKYKPEDLAVPALLSEWRINDGYNAAEVLSRRYSKEFRIKPRQFGGFTVYGVAVPVPPGYYVVELTDVTSADRDYETMSTRLMVEAGEITEFDLRRKRRAV